MIQDRFVSGEMHGVFFAELESRLASEKPCTLFIKLFWSTDGSKINMMEDESVLNDDFKSYHSARLFSLLHQLAAR